MYHRRIEYVEAIVGTNGIYVSVERFIHASTGEICWIVINTEAEWQERVLPIVRESEVPLPIRRLYSLMIARGCRTRMVRDGDIFYVEGPDLASYTKSLYVCLESITDPGNDEDLEEEDIPEPNSSMDDWNGWLDNLLSMPWNKLYLNKALLIGLRWRLAANTASRKRTIARTRVIEEELIKMTWHPSRFREWCLDSSELVWIQTNTD